MASVILGPRKGVKGVVFGDCCDGTVGHCIHMVLKMTSRKRGQCGQEGGARLTKAVTIGNPRYRTPYWEHAASHATVNPTFNCDPWPP